MKKIDIFIQPPTMLEAHNESDDLKVLDDKDKLVIKKRIYTLLKNLKKRKNNYSLPRNLPSRYRMCKISNYPNKTTIFPTPNDMRTKVKEKSRKLKSLLSGSSMTSRSIKKNSELTSLLTKKLYSPRTKLNNFFFNMNVNKNSVSIPRIKQMPLFKLSLDNSKTQRLYLEARAIYLYKKNLSPLRLKSSANRIVNTNSVKVHHIN